MLGVSAMKQMTTTICKDAGLAELDRQFDTVFKAALGKARDSMPSRLRAEQTGCEPASTENGR